MFMVHRRLGASSPGGLTVLDKENAVDFIVGTSSCLASQYCLDFLKGFTWWPQAVIYFCVSIACLLLFLRLRRRDETWRIADRFRALGIEVDEYPCGLPLWLFERCIGYDSITHDTSLTANPDHDPSHSFIAIASVDLDRRPHAFLCVTCGREVAAQVGPPNQRDALTVFGIDRQLLPIETILALLENGGTSHGTNDPTLLDALWRRLAKLAHCDGDAESYRQMPIANKPEVARPELLRWELVLGVMLLGFSLGDTVRAIRERYLEGQGAVLTCERFAKKHQVQDHICRLPADTPLALRYNIRPGTIEAVEYSLSSDGIHRCPACQTPAVLVRVRVTVSYDHEGYRSPLYPRTFESDEMFCTACAAQLKIPLGPHQWFNFPPEFPTTDFSDILKKLRSRASP